MRFCATVGVLFGLGALACAAIAGRHWPTIDGSAFGTVVFSLIAGFFLNGWGRGKEREELQPEIPEGEEVTIRGSAEVTHESDPGRTRRIYLAEFYLYGLGWRTRTVTAFNFASCATQLKAADGSLPVGTRLHMTNGRLCLKTESSA